MRESLEADEEACNEIVSYVNDRLRWDVNPWLPDEVWEDGDWDDMSAAWKVREEQLQAMSYAEYLASPEWAVQRNRAIRRADGRCQTADGPAASCPSSDVRKPPRGEGR